VAVLGSNLCQRIGDARYQLWFAGKTKLILHEEYLTVGVPNLFLHDWLKKTFAADLQAAAADVLGVNRSVRFTIDPTLCFPPPLSSHQQRLREEETARRTSWRRPWRRR
jgi:chromosomal replication initiation ATPase DnaA